MTKEIEIFDKVIKCLAIELHEDIWDELYHRWDHLRQSLTIANNLSITELCDEAIELVDLSEKELNSHGFRQHLRDLIYCIKDRIINNGKDIEEYKEGHLSLVREMDEALNGKAGMAKQASLCDLVSQVKSLLTPSADVQERAKEYVKDYEDEKEFWYLRETYSQKDVNEAKHNAYLAGASSMQAENERLRKSLRQLVWNWDNDIWADADLDEAREALTKQK